MSTPEIHRSRGLELRKRGQFDLAIAEFQQALKLDPKYPPAYFNIAATYFDQGRFDEAAIFWQKAIDVYPNYYQAYACLGAAYRHLGKLNDGIVACRKAVELQPKYIDGHTNLAAALHAAWKMDEAAAEFEAALKLDPRNIIALNNYANLLTDIDQPARAIQCLKTALEGEPNRAELYNNLGNIYKTQANITQAISCFEKTLSLKPDAWAVHSNLLLTLNCHPRSDNGLLKEHQQWADRHAAKFYPAHPTFKNDRMADRKLRIGYVSPDFRRHSVVYFFEPILQAHDRNNVETFCYSNVVRPDDITRRLQSHPGKWRDIAGMADDRVAQMIRDDQIDILVDLSGHTANHRLLVFARKPAPIQVTYLGYPNTTGLATMDYRLTDEESDPSGKTDSHYVEKLFRLPHGFLCFRPADNVPEVRTQPLPTITFGTFNNFSKVTPFMIGLWAAILRELPLSKLLIKAETLGDTENRQAIRSMFIEQDVDPNRVELLGREPAFLKHLAMYNRIDIGLDTFPYHGTTTTCEAMYMGVPVISLAGKAHVSRVGLSLLSRVGLNDLIAQSPQEYVEIAMKLAKARTGGKELREKMRNSPLMDAAGFVRGLESAYREMWQSWCEK